MGTHPIFESDFDCLTDMSPAPPKKSKFSNALEALRSETVVVADTGDVAAMEQYKPTDATTNPSLVLACLSLDGYAKLIDEAAAYAKRAPKVTSWSWRVIIYLFQLACKCWKRFPD